MRTIWMLYPILVFYLDAFLIRAPAKTGNPDPSSTLASIHSTDGSFEAGKIIDTVTCKSDPSQSYALYIPAKGNKDALPVIYFFDPHGDGELPLRKYKTLAETYGFIFVGSNCSKNGNDWRSTEKIWSHLLDDSQNRLKIDKDRIYTCGFSGGAKVAGYIAILYPVVKGVIANGAGLPDGTLAEDFNFGFTAIAGEGDMNLTEMVAFSKELDRSRTRHHLIVFEGKHEWAPASTMRLAFIGLQLDAMKNSLIPKDGKFVNLSIGSSKKRLDSDIKSNQLIRAAQECRLSISFLEGLNDKEAGWFINKLASLSDNQLYQKQRQQQETLQVREQNKKAEYGQHFQQGDVQYWDKIIEGLQSGAIAKTAESGMNMRLLAYLSLAFYSFSNRLIGNNENSAALHFVELYKMADPTNSEAWYFSAILQARDKQVQAAENDLFKAAGYGFRDENRLMHQPEFQNLFTQINFSRIRSRMHAPLKEK